MGLLAQYLPPDIGAGTSSTSFTYNLLTQLTGIAYPDSTTLALAYDAIGRVQTVTTPQGNMQFTYDRGTPQVATITYPTGGTVRSTYDALRRPTTLQWTGTITGQVAHTYTPRGELASTQINQEPAILFRYDATGALEQAGALRLRYDQRTGQFVGSDLDTIADTWRYNGFGEPVAYAATANGAALFRTQDLRDSLGRIVTRTETITATTTTATYSYDAIGQLTAVWRDGALHARYAYDANGNRTSITTGGSTTTATYDDQDRLLTFGATTFTHTPNGERASATTAGQTTRYTYDAFGALQTATLPDGTQVRYALDGLGRRVGVTVNGTPQQGFLYADDLRPVAELDGAGNVVSQFVYADRATVPAYLIKGSTTYRIIADHLGSPRLVVDARTGTVVQRLDYDAWGGIMRDSNPGFQPFGFAGGLYDPRTGLTHFGAREYDATTGRWLPRDPIGFAGGDTNLYRYVGNDPVNFVDPTGLVLLKPILVGAAISAGIALAWQLLVEQRSLACVDWWDVGWAAVWGGGTSGAFSALAWARRPLSRAILQRVTTTQNASLAGNLRLARGVLSPREYASAQRVPGLARMQYGNTVERLVARDIRRSPFLRHLYQHVGGPNNPDFVGRTIFRGINYDITTAAQIAAHLNRPYGPGLQIVTYTRPPGFTLFP